MKKSIVFLFFAIALLLALTFASSVVTANGEMPFSDVREDAWYYSYVEDVYDAGIMKGKSDKVFDPEGVVTRAEFVTAMARIAEADTEGLEDKISSFPDADVNAWYAPYMGWAVDVGLLKGQGDGRLAPSANLTRAELVTFMDRLMTYLDVTLIPDESAPEKFSDVKAGQYYTEPVEALRKTGLINGDGTGKFNPADTSQRHSMAAIISRFIEKRAAADPYKDDLAVINIVTETGRDVESKENYIRASFTLTDDDGRAIDEGSMRIRGRGNSTWMMEKKSYRLKFDDNICLMSKSSGGDTENKDWTLLANHCDKSLIRNHMAESLGRELDGIPWAPYTELVHVYLNGEYHGVYMLCEQVEVGDQRVDIEDGEKDDIGILIELDNYAEEEGEYLIDYVNIGGKMYSIK
ncbi:MAG: S-layer homology domain-containing protein, partial [Clostridia bacterium]|nr:S-layer homology domain-containing protein [Clostridia bacterium]